MIFTLFYQVLHRKKTMSLKLALFSVGVLRLLSLLSRFFSISKVKFDAFSSHIKYGAELNLHLKIEAKSVQKNTHCIFMNILYFIFPFSMSQKVLQELLVPWQITSCPHCWVLGDSGINVHRWDILSGGCQVWLRLNYSLLSGGEEDWRVQLPCHDKNSRGALLVEKKALWGIMWRQGCFVLHHNWVTDSQNKQQSFQTSSGEKQYFLANDASFPTMSLNWKGSCGGLLLHAVWKPPNPSFYSV